MLVNKYNLVVGELTVKKTKTPSGIYSSSSSQVGRVGGNGMGVQVTSKVVG